MQQMWLLEKKKGRIAAVCRANWTEKSSRPGTFPVIEGPSLQTNTRLRSGTEIHVKGAIALLHAIIACLSKHVME